MVGDARRRDLAGLVHEVALGDQHQPVIAASSASTSGTSGEQLHGLGEHDRPTPRVADTADGTVSSVTVIAAWTIDSVNAFTP